MKVNGQVAKASYNVKVGDMVEIGCNGSTKIEILKVSETVRKDEVGEMYRIIEK